MRNTHLILLTAALGLTGTACSDDVTNPVAPSTVAAVTTSQSEHSSSWSRGRRGNTVVVSPRNMRGWAFFEETPSGSGRMENGPGNPPAGRGSAELTVDNTGGWALGAALYGRTPLRQIRHLRYSTYRTFGAPALAIALQFNFDRDLTDGDESFQGRMVYEPYYTHLVLTGDWQRWNTQDNALLGNWWFTRAPQNSICSQANPCTWAEVLAAFPNSGIHRTGGVILKAGGGWVGGFDGNTDALTIQVRNRRTTYDFELDGRGRGHGNRNDDDDDGDDD